MRYVDPRYPLSELTRDVIAGFYRTYDALGFGFLELPYKRALSVEAHAPAGGLAFLSAVPAQRRVSGPISAFAHWALNLCLG